MLRSLSICVALFICLSINLFAEEAKRFAAPVMNANLKSSTVGAAELTWFGDVNTALAEARKKEQLLFLDFTGETCTNCRLNEKNVFPKEEVKKAFENHVRVSIFTDTVPESFYKKDPGLEKREEDADANKKFQKDTCGTEALPLYVLVKPLDGGKFEVISTYKEGKINDVKAFVEFLSTKSK